MSPDPTLPAQDRLDVYHGALRIGSIFDTEPLSFEYSGRWLEKSNACALPGVPLGAGRMATDAVAAVFDNLLPEGALRDYLVRRRQASTVFALLKEVAGDTAGGLVILNAGDKPARSAYQKTTWQSLAALLDGQRSPGIVRCAQLIREYSTQSAVDLLRLLEWVFFNLYVGNNDSHAKNLSIYFHPRKGTMLTPFYDLMCTRVYSGLSGRFALAVGGENLPGKIGRQQVVRMAEELGVKADYALGIAEQMAGKTIPALDAAISQIAPALSASGKVLAQKIRWEIGRISKQTSARILKSAR